MEDDILAIGPTGEAKVYSSRFRAILKAKSRSIFTNSTLPALPTPNRDDEPDDEFLNAMNEPDHTLASESFDEDSSTDSSKSTRAKSKKNKRKKKKTARIDDSASNSSDDSRSKPKPAYQSSVPTLNRPPAPSAKRAGTFRQQLQRLGADQKSREKWLAACNKILDHVFNPTNTSAQKQQEHVVAFYYAFMEEMFPNISSDEYWSLQVILDHWALFLTNMVQCSKGKDGGRIRSSTLAKWVHTFVALIGRYMVDTEGTKVGSRILSQGLFQDIQNRFKWLVQKFRLNRHAPAKGYLSERDIHAILEYGFSKTETSGGRESFIQTAFAVLCGVHMGLRVGSMGVTHVEWRKKELFPKLEDVKLHVVSPGIWNVGLAVHHRKGFNDTVEAANTLNFLIAHVKQIHHLWFDLGLVVAVMLLLRGALEGIETIDELFDYNLKELKIKEHMKKQPLFLNRKSGGYEMGTEAATADSLLESLQRLGNAIGLPFTNFHAIRRETANLFGLILGADAARRILGHGDGETTYDVNYSRNVWNFPLSEARLGALDHTVSIANQMSIMRNRKESMVVDALLNSKREGLEDGKKLTPALEALIAAHEGVASLNRLINGCWDHLFALLPAHVAVMYGRATGNAIRVQKFIKDTEEYKVNKIQIDKLVFNIQYLGTKLHQLKRQVSKRIRRQAEGTAAERKAKFAENSAQNTVDDRKALLERLTCPSKAFEPAKVVEGQLESYLDKASTILPNEDFLDPNFGNGLLAPDFIKRLQDPEVYQFMLRYGDRPAPQDTQDEEDAAFDLDEAQEDLDREDTPDREPADTTERDPEIFQEEPIPAFDDSKQQPVFEGDMLITRKMFAMRLAAPVLRAREDKRLRDMHGGWVCVICMALKHLKPGDPGEIRKFPSRALLGRHQLQLHSPWDDLAILMLTDKTETYKCPSSSCSFEAGSVSEIRSHCLDECVDRVTFQRMKHACVHERREGIDNQTLRKQARLLKAGKPLSDKTIQLYEELKSASQSEIATLAANFDKDDEDLPYRFQTLQAMLDILEQSLDFEEGTITDENAEDPVDAIHQRLVTTTFLSELQDELDTIEPDMNLEHEWLVPNLDPPSNT